MTDLISSDWSQLDADNDQPAPNGVNGGYSPSSVAPIIRTIRGSLKRFYDQSNPVFTSTGTGNAFVLTYEAAPAGYSKGIIYRFWAHTTNSGASTLNINSLGARAIVSGIDGSPMIAGAIVSGRIIEVVYNGTAFELLSLAFTTVQQGGGANQGNSKISLGMSSGNRLLMQADNTDFGDTFPININGNATTLATYTPATLPISTPVQTALNLKADASSVQTSLDLKANLASPALTGTPTAPTQTQGNNSTSLATTAYVDTGLSGQVNKAGDTMTGALGVTAARGTGATTNALVAVRNTQNGDAIITMGANNRTSGLSTFGQRANGSSFISTDTATWEMRTDQNIYLPGGGRVLGTGEIYHNGYAANMTTIIDRSRRIRLSNEQYQAVNSNGWNIVPAGAFITALYRGGNGQIEGMNYRYIHQTDINGTWQFIGTE